MSPRLLFTVVLASLTLGLSAQTVSFSDTLLSPRPGTESWQAGNTAGSGNLDFRTNGLTYFVDPAATSADREGRMLSGVSAPLTADWSARVTVFAPPFDGMSTNGAYANLSLAVFDASNSSANNTVLSLDRYFDGSVVQKGIEYYFPGTSGTPTATVSTSLTGAVLRIDYSSSANALSFYYASASTPTAFTQLGGSQSLSSWGMTSGETFGFALNAASSNFAVPADVAYFRDFSVNTTAVPEPSTNAALAGLLALAVAGWRRTRRHAPRI